MMLKSLTVSNFRVFKGPVTINFSKVRDYKFNQMCIKNNLINKAILYGRNATGKSNLGYALLDIRTMVLPISTPLGDESGFLHANAAEAAAVFEYSFIINGHEIQYRYEKTSFREIKFERLMLDNVELYHFDFERQQGDFTAFLHYDELKHLNISDEWDNETSILRYILANAKLKELMILKEWSSFVEGMAMLRPLDGGMRFQGPKIFSHGITKSIIEKKQVHELVRFLSEMEVDIPLKDDLKPDGESGLYFDFQRPLDFVKNASSGTKALTAMFAMLSNLDRITFLYIDEMDANLHFSLAEKIVNTLKSQENCQLIISTHNTDLMSNRIMRPDCYFILTPEYVVSCADATARELREGHNLEKLYQSGEFDEAVST